jgi:DNA-binding NarL/FixJ family response regulator
VKALNGAHHPALPHSTSEPLSDLTYHLVVICGLRLRLVTRRGDDVPIQATPRRAAHASPLDTLTAAELRVARLVARGPTNREVAEWLSLSSKTVEAHLSRVYRKLDVRSRAGVAFLLGRTDR